MAPASRAQTLSKASERMFKEELYTDMVVICGGRKWKCHRAVLCSRCSFFKAACAGKFKEASTLTLKLDDDSPEAIDMLLKYLYLLQIPNFRDKAVFSDTYKAASLALVLGDKYDLQELYLAGVNELKAFIEERLSHWESKPEKSKEAWITWFREVWKWTQKDADSIREHIIKRLVSMAESITQDAKFQDFIWENREFGMAFILALSKRKQSHDEV